jgi:23S rRNA pseudouridine1911/1915/1917 synthase
VRNAIVPPELDGPLDRAVRDLFQVAGARASWGAARGWIAAGKVSVGGAVVTECTARVRAGAEVTLHEQARRLRAADLPDDAVIFVDAHLVVVAKPPGVSTVPYDGSETDTLDARVRAWLARGPKGTRGLRPNLGVVHRLDKETSGLVVFTRTWLAKQTLSLAFRKHTVHRKYVAIAHGTVPSRSFRSILVENRGDGLRGSLRGSRSPRGAAAVTAASRAGGREAITHVECLERFATASLVACTLETGRTHQIRIHLSEAGHPLVGERVYVRHWTGTPIEAPRLMLHAAELGFVHPKTQRTMQWEQPMPADMRAVLDRLRG